MNMCCKAGEKHTRVHQSSIDFSYARIPITLEVKSATDLGAASKIQDRIKIQCSLIFVEDHSASRLPLKDLVLARFLNNSYRRAALRFTPGWRNGRRMRRPSAARVLL